MESAVTFTAAGAFAGARRCVPLALSVFAYGLVFGVLARQTGLTPLAALLMSALVFAGSSQFAALGLWVAPLPVGAIVLTTIIINLRYILQSAALRPWLATLRPAQVYGTLFFLADENWALTLGSFGEGTRDGAFLLGSGVALYVAWALATLVGELLGASLRDPARWGLDFAFTAVFLALLTGMWRGRGDVFPWIIAACVAAAAYRWLPGEWYILLGGLAGSPGGALRHAR